MSRSEIMAQVRAYIIEQVLDGKNVGLDEATPLLEWGIINSMEIIRLLSFINTQFGVYIPAHQMIAEHFATIHSITDMIWQAAQEKESDHARYSA